VVALCVVLCHARLVCDVGITGVVDLRGRVHRIDGLKQKLQKAREGKLESVIIPSLNHEELEGNDFHEWPHDLKKYTKEVLRGASHVIELLHYSFQGT